MAGTVYTYTIIHSAAEAFKMQTPYAVALVDDGGKRILVRIEGYSKGMSISVGAPVEFSRHDGAGNPWYKLAVK